MNNQQGKRIQKRPDDIGASSSGSSERGPGRGRGRGKSSGGGSARSSDTSTRPQRQDARQVQPQLYQNPNPASSSTAQPQQHYQSGHAQPDHSPHVPTIVRPVILGAKQASDVSLGSLLVAREGENRKQRRPERDTEPTTSKFVNEHWNMQTEATMKFMSDSTNFVVVGVLGAQGVGKSSVLSLLYGKRDQSAFNLQTKDHQLLCQHCTSGVDISITSERIILLDTQAVFSPSTLADLCKNEPPLPTECTSYEHMHELQCLQLAIFLLSVCHVVLVVQDGSCIDWKLWHFLKTATMLKTRIPDPISLGSGPQVINNITQQQRLRNQLDKIKSTLNPQDLFQPKDEYYPDLVFVFNRSPFELFSSNALLQLRGTLDKFFDQSPYKTKQPIVLPPALEEYIDSLVRERCVALKRQLAQLQNAQAQEDAEQQQLSPRTTDSNELPRSIQSVANQLEDLENTTEPHMNFTVLPEDHASHFPGSDGVELDLGIHNDTFQASSESFRNKLLSFLCNDKCIKRWEGEKITEKEWLSNASKIWLIIKKSPVILDYNKSLQSTNFKASYYE